MEHPETLSSSCEQPAPELFGCASPVVSEFCRQPSRNPYRNVGSEAPTDADILEEDADERFTVGLKSVPSEPTNSLKLTPLPPLDMEAVRDVMLSDILEEEEEEGSVEVRGASSTPEHQTHAGGPAALGQGAPQADTEAGQHPASAPPLGVAETAQVDESAGATSEANSLATVAAEERGRCGVAETAQVEESAGATSEANSLATIAAEERGRCGGAEAGQVEEGPVATPGVKLLDKIAAGERRHDGSPSPPRSEQKDRRASMQSLISNRTAFSVSDSGDSDIEEEQQEKPKGGNDPHSGHTISVSNMDVAEDFPTALHPPQRGYGLPSPVAASAYSMQLQNSSRLASSSARVGSMNPPLPHNGAASEMVAGQYRTAQKMMSFKQTASGRRLACSTQTLKHAAAGLQSTGDNRSGKEQAKDFMEQMKAEGHSELGDSRHNQMILEDPKKCSPCNFQLVQLSACASQRDPDEPASCTVT